MTKQRQDLDDALVAEGRDPEEVGIIWALRAIVGETEKQAHAMREALISDVPIEAVGVWLSHNTGYDMSQLPPRFSLAELQERIVAAQASPVGFVNLLAHNMASTPRSIARNSSGMDSSRQRGTPPRSPVRRRRLPIVSKRYSKRPGVAAASWSSSPRPGHARLCSTSWITWFPNYKNGGGTGIPMRARRCEKTSPFDPGFVSRSQVRR